METTSQADCGRDVAYWEHLGGVGTLLAAPSCPVTVLAERVHASVAPSPLRALKFQLR